MKFSEVLAILLLSFFCSGMISFILYMAGAIK